MRRRNPFSRLNQRIGPNNNCGFRYQWPPSRRGFRKYCCVGWKMSCRTWSRALVRHSEKAGFGFHETARALHPSRAPSVESEPTPRLRAPNSRSDPDNQSAPKVLSRSAVVRVPVSMERRALETENTNDQHGGLSNAAAVATALPINQIVCDHAAEVMATWPSGEGQTTVDRSGRTLRLAGLHH